MSFKVSAIEALDDARSTDHDEGDYLAFRAIALAVLDVADAIRETSQVEHFKNMLKIKPDVQIHRTNNNQYVVIKHHDGTIDEFKVTQHKTHKA